MASTLLKSRSFSTLVKTSSKLVASLESSSSSILPTTASSSCAVHNKKRLLPLLTRHSFAICTRQHRKSTDTQPLWRTQTVGRRTLFWSVTTAFNKVDKKRVEQAGPDRACAEWVLRNGGSVKWTNSSSHLKDFNFLPSTNFKDFKLEEIDVSRTQVIGMGFLHLENLKDLKTIKIHGVGTVMDDALEHFLLVGNTLECVDISRCAQITEKGLAKLVALKNLKELLVYDLPEIKDIESFVSGLRQSMPRCHISTSNPYNAQDDDDDDEHKQMP